MVETGIIGTGLLVFILIACLTGHLKRLLTISRTPESLLFVGLSTLLVIRSFVEIDILNPYQVGSFLFYFMAGRLTLAVRPVKAKADRPQYGFMPNSPTGPERG